MYVTRELLFPPLRPDQPLFRGLAELSPKILERNFALFSLFSRGNYILYHLVNFLQHLDYVMADANKAAVHG